jgi:hypothetical protein
LATAKSWTLNGWHLLAIAVTVMALIMALAATVSYLTMRHAAELRLPFLQEILRTVNVEDAGRTKAFVRANFEVMANKLGEMQAQLLRLDAIGARLAGMAGLQPQEIKAVETRNDGRGGPLIAASPMSPDELARAMDALSRQLTVKSETMTLIEAQLLDERIRKNQLPTSLPVNAEWSASAFGWRIDPFNGQRAMHEGVDFVSAPGTPISAAAAGIVIGGRPVGPLDVDLRWVGGIMYRNSEIEETGLAAGVLGHPALGVAWLANKICTYGHALEPGHIVLAGSFTRVVFAQKGDTLHADFGPLGGIAIQFV